jgi:hypothetical protein
MLSGSCLTSKPYDAIIKMLSKSHETIPLRGASRSLYYCGPEKSSTVLFSLEHFTGRLAVRIYLQCTV